MLPLEASCPSESELGGYVGGELELVAALVVARHVETCFECSAVVAETRLFLAEQEHAAMRKRAIAAAAAAVIFVAGMLAIHHVTQRGDSLSELRTVAAGLEQRPVEGRLAGFAHRPFDTRRSVEASSQTTIALRAASEAVPEMDLHARGVAALLSSQPATAVRLLRAATETAPTDATVWNDLAAANLALASDQHDPKRLVEALAAADRSLKLAPNFAPAAFNRAVALEHRGRNREAIMSYQRALATERSEEGWRIEINERVQRLPR